MLVLTRQPRKGRDTILVGGDKRLVLRAIRQGENGKPFCEVDLISPFKSATVYMFDVNNPIEVHGWNNVRVGISRIDDERVRFAFDAPKSIRIIREEIAHVQQ